MKNKNSTTENFIDLKEILSILKKGKWVFVITFLIVLIAGIFLTFFIAPEYNLKSELKMADGYFYYNDELCSYFPVEAGNMWLLPGYNREYLDLENALLNIISVELKSDLILDKVISELDYDISKSELKKTIDVVVAGRVLILDTYHKDKKLVYDINKSLLKVYINFKKLEHEQVYDDLVNKIEAEIINIEEGIYELSEEHKQYTINLNIKFIKELEKSGLSSTGIDFISPFIKEELATKCEDYNNLSNIKDILIENKDFFTNRIEVIKEPEISNIQNNTNYTRNLLLSIIAAIVFGLIIVFIVNRFKYSKK